MSVTNWSHVQRDNDMILGLRTAIYPVSDLNEGKEWYRRVLGVDAYFDEPFYLRAAKNTLARSTNRGQDARANR